MTISTAAPRPGLRDRLRRERYLLALTLWLDEDYPSAQRRDLVSQLRRDLDDAAADTSMLEALRSLGPARRLAGEYGALLSSDRPRWSRAAAVVTACALVWLAAVSVFAAALWQVAPDLGPAGASARLLWGEVTVVRTGVDVSLAWEASFPWGLLLALVIFVVVARAWRVVPAMRPRTEETA